MDGVVNPTDVIQSYLKGAKANGKNNVDIISSLKVLLIIFSSFI